MVDEGYNEGNDESEVSEDGEHESNTEVIIEGEEESMRVILK